MWLTLKEAADAQRCVPFFLGHLRALYCTGLRASGFGIVRAEGRKVDVF